MGGGSWVLPGRRWAGERAGGTQEAMALVEEAAGCGPMGTNRRVSFLRAGGGEAGEPWRASAPAAAVRTDPWKSQGDVFVPDTRIK